MAPARIAVLFDAENINCETALQALALLKPRGELQVRRAVGDFSSSNLATWIVCARDHGIELVFQPSLGKGKNAADIRLTIEAMDIVHGGHIDTVALVTRDRDFAPVALRLRQAGITVLGLAQTAPNKAFAAACTSFELLGAPEVSRPAAGVEASPSPLKATANRSLNTQELERLRSAIAKACLGGPVCGANLRTAIRLAEPDLLPLLSGKGKFQKALVAHGLVKITGHGAEQRLEPAIRQAA